MIDKNSRVLIIGNTGFIGCWLTLFLSQYTKNLKGISLNNHTFDNFSLYNSLNLKQEIKTHYFDISHNFQKLSKLINNFKPDIIYYLASQTLVLESYKHPAYTLKNNINSLINFMECIRKKKYIKNVIIFTSDKCYTNNGRKLKEDSPLGGDDPYSASKAAKEIIINSYIQSFSEEFPKIVNIRAGNIIGGGDWNLNRIVPDIFKAKLNKKVFYIRNPNHSRPWQHVIIPIYLSILIIKKIKNKKYFFDSFNIGPDDNSFTVKNIVDYASSKFEFDFKINNLNRGLYKEKKSINLSNNKLKNFLKNSNFKQLNIHSNLDLTFDWYISIFFKKNKNLNRKKFTLNQIKEILATISSKV